MEKQSKAYEDRLKMYQKVERIYKTNNRYAINPMRESINEVDKLSVLGKVFFICVVHVKALKGYTKITDLYDSLAYIYLHTFKNIRDGNEYNKKMLLEFRCTFTTIERCLRFIKSDYPHLFDCKLIIETNKRNKINIESHGNESVLRTEESCLDN